jgi:DNA repair protein SbcD/Mre11
MSLTGRIFDPMRILHTADWHLGRRQGRIDRADDLRRAVERVMAYCEIHDVEVLIIAGDLFEVKDTRPDELCRAFELLSASVQSFLRRGDTILAITGNHDGETFCQTINHALGLVDTSDLRPGTRLINGCFHLFTEESFHRLVDRSGFSLR